ncbi:MAG: helix-turn-helix domain-containing protein [Synergistes sp.]|nr:helix-turn-helix domain-containing protein [Synergistes sp.]
MIDINGNFFIVDNFIFECGLKPRDIAVYCCICRHTNRQSGVAFPSRRTIAKECGIGKVDTVDTALKVLCEKGLIIKRHGYRADGGFQSNVYTIAAPESKERGQ